MELRKLLFYIALVQMCTAATCGGGSDLLQNLYTEAFKSGLPLIKDPEKAHEPLVGSWMVEKDRMLIVTKRDEKCLFFRFLSPGLSGEDVTYKAYTNTVGNKPFISLLAYQEQFMYFKVEKDTTKNMKLMMVKNTIRKMNPTGTLVQFLQKPGTDTMRIWRSVYLTNYSEVQKDKYIARYYGGQIKALETFDKFKAKFPDCTKLDSLHNVAIEYTLTYTHSIKKLMDYAAFYPEITVRAKKAALKKCYNTTNCLEYISYFPKDANRDSLVSAAFALCDDKEENIEKLIVAFPNDERCNGFDFKLAQYEANRKRSGRYYSPWDREAFEKRCAALPSIKPLYANLENINSINLSKNGFVWCGYGLSKQGQNQVDSLVKYVKAINSKSVNITDLYFVLNADTNTLSQNGQVIFFKVAVNRCIYLRTQLQEKLPGIAIHCIPYIEKSTHAEPWKHSGQFFTHARYVGDEKSRFAGTRSQMGISKIKIDEYGALRNTEFLEEAELIDMILEMLPEQINLYLKQQPYARVIPVNYWDEAYRNTQPDFQACKEKIMNKAAEKGFDVKKLQYFVME